MVLRRLTRRLFTRESVRYIPEKVEPKSEAQDDKTVFEVDPQNVSLLLG